MRDYSPRSEQLARDLRNKAISNLERSSRTVRQSGESAAHVRELIDVIGLSNIGHALGASPRALRDWASDRHRPGDDQSERLRILHECVVLIAREIDPHSAIAWLFGPSIGRDKETPARWLSAIVLPPKPRATMIASAREFVFRKTGRRLTDPPRDPKVAPVPTDPAVAAEQFLRLIAPAVAQGRVGHIVDDRILLRPPEALHIAALEAERLGAQFDYSSRRVGAGLLAHGAKAEPGKTTSARRVAGKLTRVWDLPLSALPDTPLHL